ncbi:tRNA pseudouridine(38-40) synthase [Sarcina sp. DSM 11001]|uniref:tRNA pseudouridine synthase A n=1 Tax=Sarcina sp. DSM 11001 TaxID=1798184 RepID=UPI00088EC3DC|nr:tRNA pseudouridine synthase A [Sarcina sp. DSM 11001]SDL52595.1 tRNA pseudouridine(38-40) synthase [Sarcina sp. DSM 11001]
MSKRILLSVAYDGTDYAGFQAQKSGVPTIEGELNRALTELTGVPVEVIGASRTDSGVHARCNLAVFDTESRIPPEKFAHAINVRLPDQICVQTSMEVPADFHPRRCSTVKTYEYRIWNAQMPDPMRRLYTYFSRYRFDIDKMREAAAYLVGEHDFKSFCSTYTSAKTTVREVLAVDVEEILPGCETALPGSETALPGSEIALPGSEIALTGSEIALPGSETALPGSEIALPGSEIALPGSEITLTGSENVSDSRSDAGPGSDSVSSAARMPREIVIRVTGRGFLYNMVRIIAGTLMEVGRGAKTPDQIPDILNACDRRAAGPTAPACGLTLVRYEILEPGMERVFDIHKTT